jgi:hypothetical protein
MIRKFCIILALVHRNCSRKYFCTSNLIWSSTLLYLRFNNFLSPWWDSALTFLVKALRTSSWYIVRQLAEFFLYVIEVLYVKLKPLIIWPERESLRKTMPMVFRKHYPKCLVILDCFGIFLDRPTNLLSWAQTYSSYKHHNSVKYLIGVTPQGTVSYISEGWGGKTSDKHITEHCTLLSNLIPGDTVLADRGFDISDSVGHNCSCLEIPAFSRGK